jgi:hypothetical protein
MRLTAALHGLHQDHRALGSDPNSARRLVEHCRNLQDLRYSGARPDGAILGGFDSRSIAQNLRASACPWQVDLVAPFDRRFRNFIGSAEFQRGSEGSSPRSLTEEGLQASL